MEHIFQHSWQVPFGEVSLKLDPLSLIFLLAVSILVVSAGLYGVGYMRLYRGARPVGMHIFFYLLLALALVVVITANNVILFLGAWEVMTVATYFLIVFNDEKAATRKAGFLYLIATHCGVFCLFLMFFLMSHISGSMNFDAIARTSFSPVVAGTIFCLALLGFGIKAGLLPFHIWLPHAHPAAPSHISALLSGVAIKTGIYGICRILWIMGALPDWCAYVLLIMGVVSGVMGVLYALGQHELKKLLAYHSIENIGIIVLGLGVGSLGRGHQMPFLTVIGFGGALLHVFNHSLFKGLLFLGAGAVIQKTRTGEMDRMGGLSKVMPLVSVLFLVGALAICGLPLFNGFISEFIIFFGLFQGLIHLPLPGAAACALGILALALMGALALACFTKVYGTVFLGRSRRAGEPVMPGDPSRWMTIPMLILAGSCVWIGLAPETMGRIAFSGGEYIAHLDSSRFNLDQVMAPLSGVIGGAFVFLALGSLLIFLRRFLLRRLSVPVNETWACGFSQVTPRFQYSSASFAYSIVNFVKALLLSRRHGGQLDTIFPGKAHVSSSVHDAAEESMFRPLLSRLGGVSKILDDNQVRHTQWYLMYIFLFLIFLLAWKMR